MFDVISKVFECLNSKVFAVRYIMLRLWSVTLQIFHSMKQHIH